MTRRDLLAVAAAVSVPAPPVGSDRWQIVERTGDREVSWRDLPARLKPVPVVFVGEQHDDPQTHRVELALLESLYSLHGDGLALGMEMFDRDQQQPLDRYLAGEMNEAAFKQAVKLWSNYQTDYRPMVEWAKAHRVPVVGTNAPQRLVRQVGKEGLLAMLKTLPLENKKHVASFVLAPENDDYFRRFSEIMSQGHGDGKAMDEATVRRFYEAQCLRDDTMAETIARERGKGRAVLHINGGFHSNYGLGTAARLRWRLPLEEQIVLSVVPARDTAERDKRRKDADTRAQGDFLIFVPEEQAEQKK